MPQKLFDSHMHIIDPRFTLLANDGYLPAPFTLDDYHRQMAPFDLCGGVIVSGSFQGFDQSYLRYALAHAGKNFVGITQIPATTTDTEICDLHQIGVRGLRFNVRRGGSLPLEQLEAMAWRVFHLVGWHIELYIENKDLPDLAPRLLKLPAVSIDHLGLTEEGWPTLLQLVEKGVKVKASGFSRTELDIHQALQTIFSINPHALLFGSDLPGTRAPHPFSARDITCILEALGPDSAPLVLYENALSFYKLTGR